MTTEPVGGPTNVRLGEYQAVVLDVLHRGTAGEAMAAEIQAAARAAALPTDDFDPILVEVAADLTRTWGRLAD